MLSFDEDMDERDRAAETAKGIIANGGQSLVILHADLDNREIHRVIARYKDIVVNFHLAEDDSTPAQRTAFRRLWKSAGGAYIPSSDETTTSTKEFKIPKP